MKLSSAGFLLLASVAVAGEPTRSGYEVALSRGEETWRATTVAPVATGQPIQQGLGPYVVSLQVTESRKDAYTLLLRVTGQPGSATETSEFIRKSFTGDHREPLEFAASEADLAVKGVIFLGPLQRAAR